MVPMPRASAEEYMDGTPDWRTDLYAEEGGQLMTHAESIALFKQLGVKFTPELKAPVVAMPFDGFSQDAYAEADRRIQGGWYSCG